MVQIKRHHFHLNTIEQLYLYKHNIGKTGTRLQKNVLINTTK